MRRRVRLSLWISFPSVEAINFKLAVHAGCHQIIEVADAAVEAPHDGATEAICFRISLGSPAELYRRPFVGIGHDLPVLRGILMQLSEVREWQVLGPLCRAPSTHFQHRPPNMDCTDAALSGSSLNIESRTMPAGRELRGLCTLSYTAGGSHAKVHIRIP